MRPKAIEIACPECLRKRLRVFRVDEPGQRAYFVTDPLQNRAYEFAAWQFFVLELLTDCESFSRLALLVEDRYGEPISANDVDVLLSFVGEKRLFAVSERTPPLLADFNQRKSAGAQTPSQALPRQVVDMGVPAVVRQALALDAHTSRQGWRLFDPAAVLRAAHPSLARVRRTIYLLPLLLVPALIIVIRYHGEFADDLLHRFGGTSLAAHAVLGLLTVNLMVTFMSAVVAYHYGVIASAFCIIFYFGFWPRFMVRVGSVEHLPRRAQLWYYAAPLLVRLTIFSLTVMVWFATRDTGEFLARFSLAVAFIAEIDFLVTSIPLIDSNGYRLLATALDTPKMRPKATIALANKLRRTADAGQHDNRLVVYAIASALFMAAVIAAFVLLLGQFLEANLGSGATVLILLVIGTVLCFRIAKALKRLDLAIARAARFRNWRNRETHEAD